MHFALLSRVFFLLLLLWEEGRESCCRQGTSCLCACIPSLRIPAFLLSRLGVNRKFQITGRPNRPCGSLTTSKVYMIRAQTFVFFPIVLDHTDFYMSLDLLLLIDKVC